jgi:hypothetical protein
MCPRSARAVRLVQKIAGVYNDTTEFITAPPNHVHRCPCSVLGDKMKCRVSFRVLQFLSAPRAPTILDVSHQADTELSKLEFMPDFGKYSGDFGRTVVRKLGQLNLLSCADYIRNFQPVRIGEGCSFSPYTELKRSRRFNELESFRHHRHCIQSQTNREW